MKITDVDDDDEYMNAAAAHAAFVMTVSAARMYWLLRHAQHARDINIHKLHPLPKNIGLGSADFLHSGTSQATGIKRAEGELRAGCSSGHGPHTARYIGIASHSTPASRLLPPPPSSHPYNHAPIRRLFIPDAR